MEILVALSLLLAGLVGGGGLIVAYRRRQAEQKRVRGAEMQALDERIASRIADLRAGRGQAEEVPEGYHADEGAALPALLPVESEPFWGRWLGLGGASDEVGRRTLYRDTAIVAGAGVLLLLLASQLLPGSTPPPPDATATPSSTNVAGLLPTGTPDLLKPTASPTEVPAETATPTVDITFEPTATPRPTARPTSAPPGSTPKPTAKPDTTPPTAPLLSGYSVGATQINLTWSGSTDNVGVVKYRVYRGGVQIAETTGTTYSDTGLIPGTQYTYTVKAVDAANNASASSNPAPLTTPVATPAPTESPTPVPTATPTPVPTDTPAPTDTPVPTDTPSPPP